MNLQPTRRELLDRLKRLAQCATVARRRWDSHEERCKRYQDDEPEDDLLCSEGIALHTRALTFDSAVATLKGTLVWK